MGGSVHTCVCVCVCVHDCVCVVMFVLMSLLLDTIGLSVISGCGIGMDHVYLAIAGESQHY